MALAGRQKSIHGLQIDGLPLVDACDHGGAGLPGSLDILVAVGNAIQVGLVLADLPLLLAHSRAWHNH